MVRFAVLCPSEIAFRRFMPALKRIKEVTFVGVGHANEIEWFGKKSADNNLSLLKNDLEKAEKFVKEFGGSVFDSYESIVCSPNIDAVYIPLPPGLHFKWAKKALEHGKHVLVEKPATTSLKDTEELVMLAKGKGLAFHENYMFVFHDQLNYIRTMLADQVIGEIRLFRISFGFPFRGKNDFRYSKALGGGALLDCGGYAIKLASLLLGPTTKLVSHSLSFCDGFDVDVYGSGTLTNELGQIAQISFGMDNSYRCDLDIWGSIGSVFTGRIMTAPNDLEPIIRVSVSSETQEVKLKPDDSFLKSINHFLGCISNEELRNHTYDGILSQARIVDEFKVK